MTRDECRQRFPGLSETQIAALYGDERAQRAIWLLHLIGVRRRPGHTIRAIADELLAAHCAMGRAA